MGTHFRAFIAALISSCAFTLCMPTSAAPAETKRFALLFGNGHYRHAAGLRDPAADVTDLSASLARAGYAVRVLVDADYGSMRAALRDYARQADGADAAIVYFAGYGMEMNGEDWLIPSDAELRSESAVENEAVSLKSVVSSVSNAQSFGLVILDAARANPFDADMKKGKDGRTVARGLVAVETPDNVFVAQSAKEGEVTPESAGRLSPFTAALVSRIGEPGLQLEYLFRDVGEEVAAATDGAQASTLYGDTSDKPAYVVPAGETVAQGPPIAADQIAWSFLEGTNDVASLHAFSESFPDSTKKGQASARISALEDGTASPILAVAVDTDSVAEAPLLLAKGVGTAEDAAKLARRFKGDTPEVQKAWAVIAKVGSAKVSNAFQSLFPGVARRTVHAARRPSPAARVASARHTPFRVAHRAPVLSTLPVFVVRPRVTNNPLVALRDKAYAVDRPSPIKRAAVRERDCEARRWYRDVGRDFDDCDVPWSPEERSDGPVALYNPQALDGGRYSNRDLNLAAGVIGPEPTGTAPLANGQAQAGYTQGSNNPAAAPVATGLPIAIATGAVSEIAPPQAGSLQLSPTPTNVSILTPQPASSQPSPAPMTVPSLAPASVPPQRASAPVSQPAPGTTPRLIIMQQNLAGKTNIGSGIASKEVPGGGSSGNNPAPPDMIGQPIASSSTTASTSTTKTSTDGIAKASGSPASSTSASSDPGSTGTKANAPGSTTATGPTIKTSSDDTTKASSGPAPSASANTVLGSTTTAAKAGSGGATTGPTETAPTTTAVTTTEPTAKAAGEVPSVSIGAAPTGNIATATAATTAPSGAAPATSSQVSPVSGTTGASSIGATEVSPVSTAPVVAAVPIVTRPVTIVSTKSPASSGRVKGFVSRRAGDRSKHGLHGRRFSRLDGPPRERSFAPGCAVADSGAGVAGQPRPEPSALDVPRPAAPFDRVPQRTGRAEPHGPPDACGNSARQSRPDGRHPNDAPSRRRRSQWGSEACRAQGGRGGDRQSADESRPCCTGAPAADLPRAASASSS